MNFRQWPKPDLMLKRINLFSLLLCLFLPFSVVTLAQQPAKLRIKTVEDLQQYFIYKAGRGPLLIAHRGGTVPGLPENCISTYAYTVKNITPILEIDPRLTKDSVIVIMHDATLDRTTNGKGKVSDYTWKQLQELKLKDAQGNLTAYRIPSLEETIKWAKGKSVLFLDHKDVPLAMMTAKIKEWDAAASVVLSAFELPVAKAYHELNPALMLEVYIKNREQLTETELSGLPLKNVIAYVSQPKTKDFYQQLHAKGLMAIVYTATVVEKDLDETTRKKAYQAIIESGGDIILANKIAEVASVIRASKH